MCTEPVLSASFIVKIWVEEGESESGKVWRGSITHVGSGERRYVKRVEDLTQYFVQYLKSIEVDKSNLTT
jgi:hypothetical protein